MKTFISRYDVIKESFIDEDGNVYEGYGILIKNDLNEEIMRISDITTNRNNIEILANRCNEGAASLIHIFDIIEDFIG